MRDVCDEYVPVICALKRIDTGLSFGATVATALCTASGLASSLALVPTRGASGILFGYVVKFCTPVAVSLEIATTLSGLINGFSLDMRLTTDKDVLTETGDTATITAEVTFFGLRGLCHNESTASVSDRFAGGINKRIAKLMMKRSKRLDRVKRIAEKLGKSETAFFFMAIENAVGYALTRGRMDLAFQAAADKMCGYFGVDTAAQKNFVGIPADGSEFSLVAYAGTGGTQRLSANEFKPTDDGSGAFSGTYSLSCPAGFSGTLVVKGNKRMCDEPKKADVRVSCANACPGAEVNIPDAALRAAIENALGKDAGDPITPTEMSFITWLDTDYLGATGIRSLKGLECASRLEVLRLSGYDEVDSVGSIADLSPLTGLTALRELHLDRNRITDLSPLVDLPALEILSLAHNQLTQVSLSDKSALEILSLEHNRLTRVSLSDLPVLEHLRLHDNQLTQVSLSGMPALKVLKLHHNQLAQVSLPDALALRELSLHDNQLAQVSLPDAPVLRELSLHDNQLTQVSLPEDLPALENLYLADNQLRQVPLSDMPALTALSLDRNQLTQVSLSDMPALATLSLRGNRQPMQVSLSGMPALDYLPLQDSQLTQISLSDLALVALYLNSNQVTQVSLSGMPALIGLGLEHNQLTQVSLSDTPALKNLVLRYNQLTQVSLPDELPALEVLDLSYNRIANIGFLVSIAGLDRGDNVDLWCNPLDDTSRNRHIPALLARGVQVGYHHEQDC